MFREPSNAPLRVSTCAWPASSHPQKVTATIIEKDNTINFDSQSLLWAQSCCNKNVRMPIIWVRKSVPSLPVFLHSFFIADKENLP